MGTQVCQGGEPMMFYGNGTGFSWGAGSIPPQGQPARTEQGCDAVCIPHSLNVGSLDPSQGATQPCSAIPSEPTVDTLKAMVYGAMAAVVQQQQQLQQQQQQQQCLQASSPQQLFLQALQSQQQWPQTQLQSMLQPQAQPQAQPQVQALPQQPLLQSLLLQQHPTQPPEHQPL